MATFGDERHCHLSVVVTNPTTHDITIPPRCVVAELNAVQSLYLEEHNDHDGKTSPIPKSVLEFNFGDSPIPPEWKSRLTKRLQGMPEVFSLNPQDFVCTDKVKHQINPVDETPFKHRARPIHPEDLEVVKRHLQELLDPGVSLLFSHCCGQKGEW